MNFITPINCFLQRTRSGIKTVKQAESMKSRHCPNLFSDERIVLKRYTCTYNNRNSWYSRRRPAWLLGDATWIQHQAYLELLSCKKVTSSQYSRTLRSTQRISLYKLVFRGVEWIWKIYYSLFIYSEPTILFADSLEQTIFFFDGKLSYFSFSSPLPICHTSQLCLSMNGVNIHFA